MKLSISNTEFVVSFSETTATILTKGQSVGLPMPPEIVKDYQSVFKWAHGATGQAFEASAHLISWLKVKIQETFFESKF